MSEGEGEEGFSCIFDIYFFGIFIFRHFYFRPKQGESSPVSVRFSKYLMESFTVKLSILVHEICTRRKNRLPGLLTVPKYFRTIQTPVFLELLISSSLSPLQLSKSRSSTAYALVNSYTSVKFQCISGAIPCPRRTRLAGVPLLKFMSYFLAHLTY